MRIDNCEFRIINNVGKILLKFLELLSQNIIDNLENKMKIYFSASIAGGRKYLDTYKRIVVHLKNNGHNVLSEHIIQDDIFDHEEKWAPKNVFEQDMKWLNECEVVIAEVSNPSLGVGYEICYALTKGLKVLCAYEAGLFISKMITGNTSETLELFEYRNEEELLQRIDEFLPE